MKERNEPLNVLVADDSEDFRSVACSWIATQPLLRLAGTAANGLDAVAFVGTADVDLILMDAFMPVMDGFEATRRIKSRPEAPWVVIVSVHEGSAIENEAWVAGADGFVPKSEFAAKVPSLIWSLREEQLGYGADAPFRRPRRAPPLDAPHERRAEGFFATTARAFLQSLTTAPRRLVSTGRASAKGEYGLHGSRRRVV